MLKIVIWYFFRKMLYVSIYCCVCVVADEILKFRDIRCYQYMFLVCFCNVLVLYIIPIHDRNVYIYVYMVSFTCV